jgi:hypothetical protein
MKDRLIDHLYERYLLCVLSVLFWNLNIKIATGDEVRGVWLLNYKIGWFL